MCSYEKAFDALESNETPICVIEYFYNSKIYEFIRHLIIGHNMFFSNMHKLNEDFAVKCFKGLFYLNQMYISVIEMKRSHLK